MKQIKKTQILILISSLILAISLSSETSSSDAANNLVVKGLVLNLLNLTYAEVENFPMISEIAQLQCVYAPNGTLYNWTGIPLFFLLNSAKMHLDSKEVVFRAKDGFSSSLTLDKAMHPSTILALKVNGTTIPEEDSYFSGGLAGGYPYKIVVPCKWGYKWIGWIDEIEVVNYDYKGFYESRGFSDEADIPNCTRLPETIPAYTVLNATWQDTYELTVFSNATLVDAAFNQKLKHVYFNISSNSNSESFVYVIVPKLLLTADFTVIADDLKIQFSLVKGEENSFLYFTLNNNTRFVEIKGMLLADVTSSTAGVADGKVDMRDISVIAKAFGTRVEDVGYVVNYDINKDELIDMRDIGIAAKQFGKTLVSIDRSQW